MVLEKKMLIFSFLAILIGIASILPLPFLMSGKATVATDGTEAKAQFNLNLPYVFIKINGSGPDLSYEQQYFPEQFKPRFSGTIYEESYVRNVTCLANPEEGLPEAVAEYFNIQVYTDKEILVNKTTFYGGMFSALDIEAVRSIQFKIDKWFDSTPYNDSGGSFGAPLDLKRPQISASYMATGINASEMPQKIYMSISRLSTVLFYRNSTIVSQSTAGIIQQMVLQKYRDGYLYNTIFTEEQLSQMDLLHPKVS